MTPLQLYRQKWARGCGNVICREGKAVALCRGQVPCDVLYVGEAPGVSEDVFKQPFKGPAGILLDRIDRKAFVMHQGLTRGYCNLVGCIPKYPEDGGKKAGEPNPEDIVRCKPRLEEFIRLCKPKLIVNVGVLSKDWFESKEIRYGDIPTAAIDHPAFILHQNIANQGLLEQRCTITLETALDDVFGSAH